MRLKQRLPFLRWSFWRLAIGARNITKTGQIGDGRESAAADYVVANARQATSMTRSRRWTSSRTKSRS